MSAQLQSCNTSFNMLMTNINSTIAANVKFRCSIMSHVSVSMSDPVFVAFALFLCMFPV